MCVLFSAHPVFFGRSHFFRPPVHFCGRNLGSLATLLLETGGGQRGSQAYNLPSQHFDSLM